MKTHLYFIYITTNPSKTVLYVGVTNNLAVRIRQHYENRGKPETFAGKHFCYELLYWESFPWIQQAIDREKEIKRWTRKQKEELIATTNPRWGVLEVG